MNKGQGKSTVLLIDDDSNIRKMMRHRLEGEGYNVITATQGDMGLSMAKREHPDLILLDVLMPQMDGREVLRRLKDDPETKAIPVGVLTVVGTEEAISEPIGPGAAFHLTKPYESRDLLEKIKLALAGRPPH